jgi:hypothetical protein
LGDKCRHSPELRGKVARYKSSLQQVRAQLSRSFWIDVESSKVIDLEKFAPRSRGTRASFKSRADIRISSLSMAVPRTPQAQQLKDTQASPRARFRQGAAARRGVNSLRVDPG